VDLSNRTRLLGEIPLQIFELIRWCKWVIELSSLSYSAPIRFSKVGESKKLLAVEVVRTVGNANMQIPSIISDTLGTGLRHVAISWNVNIPYTAVYTIKSKLRALRVLYQASVDELFIQIPEKTILKLRFPITRSMTSLINCLIRGSERKAIDGSRDKKVNAVRS